jgi:hypothetical protein
VYTHHYYIDKICQLRKEVDEQGIRRIAAERNLQTRDSELRSATKRADRFECDFHELTKSARKAMGVADAILPIWQEGGDDSDSDE